MTRAPAPGHPQARAQGCTCSPEANRDGQGAPDPTGELPAVHWIAPDCPLHPEWARGTAKQDRSHPPEAPHG